MTETKTDVSVFTGFLGAGKTTLLLSLVEQLPKSYKVVLLKNEFGDVKVDSELAKESNVQVTEMLNGCLCCVLVGQMKNAILEIKEKLNPDRILIETSGSAFPGPIAWQMRELEKDGVAVRLDSIITVVDCINFRGYEDKSYTAKLQAKYSDLILLNKHELVSERELDIVIDHVNDLNTDTPKVKVSPKSINADMIFGHDTKLFQSLQEVHSSEEANNRDHNHHDNEVDLFTIECTLDQVAAFVRGEFERFLDSLPGGDFFRIKGVVRLAGEGFFLVNYAFARKDLRPLTTYQHSGHSLRLTCMGQDFRMHFDKMAPGLQVPPQCVKAHYAH
eukprot:Colp12_sorted_trinity150504_noHs@19769